MNKKLITQKTKKFVKDRLDKEGTGHDWWHIERVINNAKFICKKEEADWFIVEMSLLLHDVGDRKVLNTLKDDYTIAENWLKKNKVPVEIIENIVFIIKNMSFSSSLNNKLIGASKEFYVVQDADRLDALGAIGIARAFAFGGSRKRSLYDPTQKAEKLSTSSKYRKGSSSSFHHFYEKVLLLKDLMNTQTARRIAKERDIFVKNYLKQFLAEWEGKK